VGVQRLCPFDEVAGRRQPGLRRSELPSVTPNPSTGSSRRTQNDVEWRADVPASLRCKLPPPRRCFSCRDFGSVQPDRCTLGGRSGQTWSVESHLAEGGSDGAPVGLSCLRAPRLASPSCRRTGRGRGLLHRLAPAWVQMRTILSELNRCSGGRDWAEAKEAGRLTILFTEAS
jgi:hypothetical protein